MNDDFDACINAFFKNYQDRGMIKWAGFYLSDHTAQINTDYQKRNQVVKKRRSMSLQEIGEQLMCAFSTHKRVKVQLKIKNMEAQYEPDIEGWIEGYDEDEVMISGQKIKLSEINNILL